jgi:hypothetical protein
LAREGRAVSISSNPVYSRRKGESPKRSFRALENNLRYETESALQRFYRSAAFGSWQGQNMVLVCMTCRFCHISFCICRSCYRRQAYCGKRCRKTARRRAHREAQRRYRQTDRGKRTHCLSENRRRHGQQRVGSKNMADQTTKSQKIHCKRAPAKHAHGVSFQPGGRGYCHFCGRGGIILNEFPRRSYGNRVYGPFPSRR